MSGQTSDDFEERLQRFDRVRWAVCVRTMQTALLRMNLATAIRELKDFAANPWYQMATIDARISDVFNEREANTLEDAGFFLLSDLEGKTDAELMQHRNLGVATVNMIRTVLRRVGLGCHVLVRDEDMELADDLPEITVDELRWQHEERQTMNQPINPIDHAIELLTSKADDAIRTIDEKIATLESQLDKLKRVRKMLGRSTVEPQAKKPLSERLAPTEQSIYELIAKRGPMPIGEVATALDLHPIQVGTAVTRSERLTKRGKTILLQKAA